jgi:ribosomal protein S18 acetylase RimI-like enzyme
MIRCSVEDVLSLTGGDPVVRGVGRGRRGPAWRSADGRAVAFSGIDAEDRVRVVVVLGEPDDAAGLALAIRQEIPAGVRLTVPRGTPLALQSPSDWNFRAAHQAPPPRPAEDEVAWREDGEAITALLRQVSPDSSAWPGDEKVRRWAAVRDGGLLACLADTSARPGVGHLSAIAVHPDARGRGLGSAITAWAMRRLFAEGCDIVTLGVYADNKPGIRMYDRLGFTVDRAMTSGTLQPTDPQPRPTGR